MACDPVLPLEGLSLRTGRSMREPPRQSLKSLQKLVVAPDADDEAEGGIRKKKKPPLAFDWRNPRSQTRGSDNGGDRRRDPPSEDRYNEMVSRWARECVTNTQQEIEDCLFAWTIAKHVKSNAIVLMRKMVRRQGSALAR